MIHRPMFALTRERSTSKGSHLDTLLGSIKLFQQFCVDQCCNVHRYIDTLLGSKKLFSNSVLTNVSNFSKGRQRNLSILVTSQWLEWIKLQCTLLHYTQLNQNIEQLLCWLSLQIFQNINREIRKWLERIPILDWLLLKYQGKIRYQDIFGVLSTTSEAFNFRNARLADSVGKL